MHAVEYGCLWHARAQCRAVDILKEPPTIRRNTAVIFGRHKYNCQQEVAVKLFRPGQRYFQHELRGYEVRVGDVTCRLRLGLPGAGLGWYLQAEVRATR